MQKKNKFLYVLFRTFSYDLLFYYTLETMFLTLVKGFGYSEVFLITSIDLAFVVLLSFPLNFIFKKVSILNRLRLGVLSFVIYIVAFMLCNNVALLCFFVLFKALGSLLLSVNSTTLLDVICRNDEANEVSKVEGKASAVFWIFEAIGAISLGYLFQVDPYSPYYFCLIGLVIALISLFFFKIPKEDQFVHDIKPQKVIDKEKSSSGKNMQKLSLCIVLIGFVFWGIADSLGQTSKVFLQDVGASSVVMGYIFFGIQLVTALFNIISNRIEKKLGSAFLPTAIGLNFFAFFIMIITFFLNISSIAKIIILAVVILVTYITRNPYRLNIKNTMTNYYNGKGLEKIYTKYYLAEHLGGAIFSLIASLTIDTIDIGYSTAINLSIACLIMIPTLILFVKSLQNLKVPKNESSAVFQVNCQFEKLKDKKLVQIKQKTDKIVCCEGFKSLTKPKKNDFNQNT